MCRFDFIEFNGAANFTEIQTTESPVHLTIPHNKKYKDIDRDYNVTRTLSFWTYSSITRHSLLKQTFL